MINNMDLLMFLISAIIAVIIVAWMALSNKKVGNYGVGENDPPETSRPLLPGEGTVNCSPPKGSRPTEPKNQYTVKTLLTPESRTRIRESIEKEGLSCKCIEPTYEAPQIPKKIPMPEVKPLKEECLYCREEDIFHNDEHDFQGDDGIMFNHKNGIFYLVMEHFRGEINMVEIKNCPKCGRRL